MFHQSPHKWLILGFTGALISMPAVACGPFFPNQLLFNSGEALTWAPVADFDHEIDGLIRKQSEFHALPPDEKSNSFDQSADLDMADLRDALTSGKIPDVQRAELLQKYAQVRANLTRYAKAAAEERDPAKAPDPLPPDLSIPKGLPAEFEAYVRGVILYDDNRKDDARTAWESILQLPADQRRYRAVWAQFMIGKSYLGDDPAKAIAAFQQVRELARKGARDSLGLAAASLGWEARAELELKHEARAIELYEAQGATGDPTAVQSLAIVCQRAFGEKDPEVLTRLAADPASARVMTAYSLALGGQFRARPTDDKAKLWLSAVEKSGTTSVIGADRLAWAAYQIGDMATAKRWVDKAPEKAPMALWVRAKLLLRVGKMDAAAKVLAEAVHAFPQDETWSGVSGTYDACKGYPQSDLSPADRVGAELGALQLARGRYVESLDRLLKAGWWLDAAYVAERVLTENELIAYVDRNCPVGTHPELRHLLARRLTRGGRWKEARPYFPDELRPRLDSYIADIRDGHNAKLSDEARATAFWNAAKIARHEGMDLLGTELTPDDFTDDGQYTGSDVPEQRQKSKDTLLPPTADELRRAASSGPNPQKRWHYRYIAADHAWLAAELMPDESDALASLLCETGGWLQAKDPKAAERFYKALVTRCGTTTLGRWARKDKWFPNTLPAPAPDLIK